MNTPFGFLLAGLCLQIFTQDVLSQDSITLRYQTNTDSHQKYQESFGGFKKTIDQDQMVHFEPSQRVHSRTYLSLTPDADGLRVSTRVLDSDIEFADSQMVEPKQLAVFAQQKAIHAFNQASPDYVINANGAVVRYDITDEYKESYKTLITNQLALIKPSLNFSRQAKTFGTQLENRFANVDKLPDSDFEPKEPPVLYNLRSLDTVVIKRDGTPTKDVKLRDGDNSGELSFVDAVPCSKGENDNKCVLLKHVATNAETNNETRYEQTQKTFLIVAPESLKPYQVEQGISVISVANDKRDVLHQEGMRSLFFYGSPDTRVPSDNYHDSARNYSAILDMPSSAKAKLIDYAEVYSAQVNHVTGAQKDCQQRSTSSLAKKSLEKKRVGCEQMKAFYTNAEKMRSLSVVDDLTPKADSSKVVRRFVAGLNTLFGQRAISLTRLEMQKIKDDGKSMTMDEQQAFMANTMKEVLLSSPVNSAKHKAYSKAMVAEIDRFISSGYSGRLNYLSR